jgi:hypothetical protein
METRSRVLIVVLLLLCVAAGAVLAGEQRVSSERHASGEAFQRLVGGLGFGPAVDLSGCAFGFDPRLDGSCAEECGPIPGGGCFCPRHAGSLFNYPPLRRETSLPVERERDAPSP